MNISHYSNLCRYVYSTLLYSTENKSAEEDIWLLIQCGAVTHGRSLCVQDRISHVAVTQHVRHDHTALLILKHSFNQG